MQFLDQGDAAPNDRFCFVYSKTGAFGNVITPALEAGAVAMQVGRPTALKGTQHVLIDPQNTSVVPTIIADRTLVPLRFVAEAFGAEVSWEQESQTAQIESGGDKISVTIGQQQIVVNGKVQAIDTQARIIADRTFVPLRAISEAFGKTVIWDPSGSILIGKHITATDQLKSQMRNALR